MDSLAQSWSARTQSDRVALVDAAGAAHTYAQIDGGARGVASRVAPHLGGGAGGDRRRVAILASPGASFLAALVGAWHAGACAVVLSPLHPRAEAEYLCGDADAACVVASRDMEPLAAALGRPIVVVEDVHAESRGDGSVLAQTRPDDPLLQLYTSGTTGRPKGAVLTDENLGTQQRLVREAWGFSDRDTLLHVLPLHHMHGLCIALMTALGAGATTRMMPFDAARVWEAMKNATVFMAVPTIYAKLLAAYDAMDEGGRARSAANARALRLATSGSAALPVTIGERWRAIAGQYPLERFGMTEIGVGITNPLAGERRPGTVGEPLPTVRTKVTSDGELWIAGPSVFAGYFRREEATREAFVTGEDGTRWFKTGDTVATDPDGYFRILGRTSVDILKSGGYKLSALEIEEALRENGAVEEVAVVGVPDETWGERVVACVVPRAGRAAECEAGSLRAFCKERLAPYKVPRAFVVMAELPKNALGKVVKPELRNRLQVTEG